jgi:hypothetical protein
MNRYKGYRKIWTPPTLPLLFVVRVPCSIEQLDESTYQLLMQQRVNWMIQQWMEETNSSQRETQHLLDRTLLQLAPAQHIPTIEENEDQEYALNQWRQEWAEMLILHTERFIEVLWMSGMNGVEFPAEPLDQAHPEFQELMELHQEIHLEEWLITLVP